MNRRLVKEKKTEGRALGCLGNSYFDLGEAQKAIKFYEERLVIACKLGDRRGEIAALRGLGKGHLYITSLEAMKRLSIDNMERKQKTDGQIRRVAAKYDNSIQFIRRFEE